MVLRTSILIFFSLLILPAPALCQCYIDVEWVNANPEDHWSPRSGHTSVVFDDKMWVMGGFLDRDPLNDVWSSSDGIHWELVTDSAGWIERSGHTSLVFDEKIWLLGGVEDGGGGLNDVWCSEDGASWIQVTDSADWPPRRGHTSVVFDGKMWVICGVMTEGPPYTLATDVWSSGDGLNWTEEVRDINPNIISLEYPTAVVFKDRIWVLGGNDYENSHGYSGRVYSSTDGRTWSQEPMLAEAYSRIPAVTFEDSIWILGGSYGFPGDCCRNTIWKSSDGSHWTMNPVEPEWSETGGRSAVVFDDRIWVLGGSGIDDVWHSKPHYKRSDMNRDGCVDEVDLFLFQREWHENSD